VFRPIILLGTETKNGLDQTETQNSFYPGSCFLLDYVLLVLLSREKNIILHHQNVLEVLTIICIITDSFARTRELVGLDNCAVDDFETESAQNRQSNI